MGIPTRIDSADRLLIDRAVYAQPFDAVAPIPVPVTATKSFHFDSGQVLAGSKLTVASDRALAMVRSGAVSLDDPDHAAALALVDGPADQRHARFLAILSHYAAPAAAQGGPR